ncbi:MAG TPA: NnrS family protein [Dongiaceae bacterium]|jgi:uncharacterized protein involved in response to NO|nr:NnrS family protein [Dongiaceae bacterium]
MSDIPLARRGAAAPAFLSFAFRPFFFCGALFAALAVPAWALVFTGRLAGGFADPLRWHAHEMIFGYLGAIIAGFLLTAIPNWTGRLPVSGWRLATLLALWLIGRVAILLQAVGALGAAPAAVLELLYWAALVFAAAREIVAGNNRRNLPVVALVAAFGIADLVSFLPDWTAVDPLLGARLALAVAAALISLIGGRIVPSFTRNWLLKRQSAALPAAFGALDKAAVAATTAAMLLWAFAPELTVTGGLLLLAALAQLVRIARWQGLRTFREPLVAILHLGYAWLVLALFALATAALAPDRIAPSAALHALTAGAIGTMTLAVMTRATLGHTGRALAADAGTAIIYLLVTAGAVLRVAAPWLPTDYAGTAALAGAVWSAAFLVFAVKYGPYLLRRRAS